MQDNAVLLYDNMRSKWPAVFGVSRTNQRASCWHPSSPTSRIEEGTRAASAVVEEKEKKKKQRRGWKHCSVPCSFLRVPPRFFSVPPHFIPVHHAVPSTSPKPPQTHRPVLRCAPLLAALYIAYHGLAFCPLYYVFGHYNQGEEKAKRKGEQERAQNADIHAWIHGGRRIKWHCDLFRHGVVCPCSRNLMYLVIPEYRVFNARFIHITTI